MKKMTLKNQIIAGAIAILNTGIDCAFFDLTPHPSPTRRGGQRKNEKKLRLYRC
jgi:hypothetical protein